MNNIGGARRLRSLRPAHVTWFCAIAALVSVVTPTEGGTVVQTQVARAYHRCQSIWDNHLRLRLRPVHIASVGLGE